MSRPAWHHVYAFTDHRTLKKNIALAGCFFEHLIFLIFFSLLVKYSHSLVSFYGNQQQNPIYLSCVTQCYVFSLVPKIFYGPLILCKKHFLEFIQSNECHRRFAVYQYTTFQVLKHSKNLLPLLTLF